MEIPFDILSKYFTGECTEAERSDVDIWMAENSENRKAFEQLRTIWDVSENLLNSILPDTESALTKVHNRIQKGNTNNFPRTGAIQKRKWFSFAVRIAAIFIIFLAIFITFKLLERPVTNIPKDFAIISNSEWENSQDTLPDGTVIFMNKGTTLKYKQDFGKTKREIEMEGEAFFEVVKNPSCPFIVNASGATVTAVGTSFNVRAYPNIPQVEVVVATGKVKFEKNTEKTEPVLLEPGLKGILNKTNAQLEISINKERNYLSWRKHNLIFKECELNKVIQTLENVYGIKIEIADKTLAVAKFTAKFEEQSIEAIIDVMKITFNIDSKVVENKIILRYYDQEQPFFGKQKK